MRIFFCGDPHGHFEHIHDAVREHRPAAIVLLGDVQPLEPLGLALKPILDLTEVWWIHGNHDTDSEADYDNLFGSALADRNLHGRVMEVAGTRIAGLGASFEDKSGMPPMCHCLRRKRISLLAAERGIVGVGGCHGSIGAPSFLMTTRHS